LAFHPSGGYLFVPDSTTNEVPILYISLPLKRLEASGASISGIPSTIAFSPDGLLVYAVKGKEILVRVFNPHTGLLTARTSISAPSLGKFFRRSNGDLGSVVPAHSVPQEPA
jgi:DNA-binding beta-propeller fold protein YncE